MAAPRWTIENYNAFLRETKRELDVSHREAQQIYRDLKEGLGRPVYGVDARRHVEDLTFIAEQREYILATGAELEFTASTEGGTP